jgi:hypothetical protein
MNSTPLSIDNKSTDHQQPTIFEVVKPPTIAEALGPYIPVLLASNALPDLTPLLQSTADLTFIERLKPELQPHLLGLESELMLWTCQEFLDTLIQKKAITDETEVKRLKDAMEGAIKDVKDGNLSTFNNAVYLGRKPGGSPSATEEVLFDGNMAETEANLRGQLQSASADAIKMAKAITTRWCESLGVGHLVGGRGGKSY